MKILMVLMLVSGSVFAETAKILPVDKAETAAKKEATLKRSADVKNKKADQKKEAPCDEKAKKPVEITPEAISLSGNTGCSLDEAH
jgi:hypothetical protein